MNSGSICTDSLNVNNGVCFTDVSTQSVCANTVTTRDLCATGTTIVNNFQQCGRYRATAVYSTITTYTLGDDLAFDLILDDPNNNMTTPPTKYFVPLSGYYIVTIQIDQFDLIPTPVFGPILGVPVANPQLYVNGVLSRQSFSSYLTFFNNQRTTMTCLMSLKAGDILTAKFKVLAINQITGFTEVAGTVKIEGNGSEQNESLLKIHYLSSDCTNGAPCQSCTPCVAQPCANDCTPCNICP